MITDTITQEVLRSWEGVVIEVLPLEFVARLFPLHVPLHGNDEELEASIFISKIHPDDTALLLVGATFYWSIANNNGTTESSIRFKRTGQGGGVA